MIEMALGAAAIAIGLLFFFKKKRRASLEDLDSYYDSSEGERYAHKWGYTDTRFEFVGPSLIRVSGSRYPLAGRDLPGFIPWTCQPHRPRTRSDSSRDVVLTDAANSAPLTSVIIPPRLCFMKSELNIVA